MDLQIHLNGMTKLELACFISNLIPIRFDTKGEFGELGKLFEEGIAHSRVQSLNKSQEQKKDNQGTLYCHWWKMCCFQILDG